MTDFNDPNTPANTPAGGSPVAGPPVATAERRPSPADPDGPDPLAHLHKMSTTAGVSSQEYVAINIPSIVALVLGLASVVAVLNPVLLVVPLAAVITALAALSQIRASNGTQTGRPFAILGIVLALGIGGFVLVRAVTERLQTQADRQAIASRIEELGRLVRAKEYDAAYKLFSTRFQNRISRETFGARWEAAQSVRDLGRINSIEWNRTNILFQADPASGARVGFAASWVKFENGNEPARYTFEFRKSGPTWEIDDLPSLFPPPEKPRRGSGPR
jgi:hypothetical protein